MTTNKRQLKKSINYICSSLFAECVAASLHTAENETQTAKALLSSILLTHSDFINRVSHPEPGMRPKTYFKHLIEDFNKEANGIVDQICAI